MTASAMSHATMQPAGYAEWITDVKSRIRAAQQRAALAVNKEMLQLYWQIGHDILDRQAVAGWGTGILSRIEADLRVEFPEMRGFSQTNLKYMRMFAEAWPDPSAMGQRFVDQLPWGQNITLLTKLKTREERLLYAARAVEHGCPDRCSRITSSFAPWSVRARRSPTSISGCPSRSRTSRARR
jgi:predicted nuclease of restriction endonuclease-like (RecB) superfamily